jgi:hypothetical protein
MEVFPLAFYHPLEPVDPCFEDSSKGFLSNFIDNVGDHTFEALPARDGLFGEFSLDITKEKEVTRCEVQAVGRVRYPLDLFRVKIFSGSPGVMHKCIVQVDA